MNKISRSKFRQFSSSALALLTTVLIATSGASAKEHKVKAVDSPARVVAHIPFAGLSTVDMTMQAKVNGKYYLYVQHSNDQGISIIDISKPAEPKAIGVMPWPNPAAFSRMNVTGDLAIIAENVTLPARRSSSDDDLELWDLSNPVAPRVVQKFSGVIKWLQDERDFIYVLNGEGLWIVSKPSGQKPGNSDSSDSYGG
jgi:hypothetical protein